jgi:hypothetical protein
MAKEKSESELKRLRTEQNKTRQDEVFGGLSPAERAEYEGKSERIHELESEIQASAVAEKRSQSAKAEQKRQWNKEPETDTPQAEAHQPTAAEKKIRRTALTDSRKATGKAKKNA